MVGEENLSFPILVSTFLKSRKAVAMWVQGRVSYFFIRESMLMQHHFLKGLIERVILMCTFVSVLVCTCTHTRVVTM